MAVARAKLAGGAEEGLRKFLPLIYITILNNLYYLIISISNSDRATVFALNFTIGTLLAFRDA